MRTILIGVILALGACATAEPPRRIGPATSPLSTSVSVSPASRLVYISGTVPDAIDPRRARRGGRALR